MTVTDEQLAEWERYRRDWPDDDWCGELVGLLLSALRTARDENRNLVGAEAELRRVKLTLRDWAIQYRHGDGYAKAKDVAASFVQLHDSITTVANA